MLLFLLEWLRSLHVKVPSAFSYSSTRMILAAATSLLFTIWLGPWFIRKLYGWKIGQPIRTKEECPLLAELHGKKKDTPTMGGLLLLTSLLLSWLLWMDLKSAYGALLVLTTLVLGVLGASDDWTKLKGKSSKGIRGKKKLFWQAAIAGLVAVYLLVPSVTGFVSEKFGMKPPVAKEFVGKKETKNLSLEEVASRFYLPFKKDPLWVFQGAFEKALLFFLFVFVIVGSSNAVNLTDGLDGLAAGCLVMVSAVLGLFAFLSNHAEIARYLHILYLEGSGEIGIYLLALAGACLGFLWYNGYPAQVFMGDTGSLALGGILGVAAVLLRRELVLAIAGALFVMEALSVILQVMSYRYRNRKRVFLCAPLHHHFEYKGWPETKVVLRFWILTLLFGLVALGSLKLQ